MRCLLFGAAVIVGVGFGSLVPTTATPLAVSGLSSQSADATLVEDIGWRRQYRRYGDYYAPPPAVDESYAPPAVAEGDYASQDGDYGDYPPANGEYPPAEGY